MNQAPEHTAGAVSYATAGIAGVMAAAATAASAVVSDPGTAATIHECGLLVAYVTGLVVVIERLIALRARINRKAPDETRP